METIEHKVFEHKIDEGRSYMKISFTDSYVTHSFDMLIHPDFSIQSVKEILEDALTQANRKQDRIF